VLHVSVTLTTAAQETEIEEVAVAALRSELHEQANSAPFVRDAAVGLATLDPEDLGRGNLTLPLLLSVWMRRAEVGVEDARDALLELRSALVEASGLDRRTEPVPLCVADPAAAVLSLARYTEGLLGRASEAARTSRLEVARRAVALVS